MRVAYRVSVKWEGQNQVRRSTVRQSLEELDKLPALNKRKFLASYGDLIREVDPDKAKI